MYWEARKLGKPQSQQSGDICVSSAPTGFHGIRFPNIPMEKATFSEKWKMPFLWKLLLFEEGSWACLFLESQSQLRVCWTASHPSGLHVQAGHWWQTRTTPAEHTRLLAPDQELIPPWKCAMTKLPAFQKGLLHSAGLGHMDIIKAAWGAPRGPKAAYLSQCSANITFTSETFTPLSRVARTEGEAEITLFLEN